MKKGWVANKLVEVSVFRSGTTLPPEIEKTTGDFPYLKVADMNLEKNTDHIVTSSRFVNMSDVNINGLIPAGSTLFPKRGGALLTNKKRITATPIYIDLNLMAVTPKKDILPSYLYYYFLQLDLRDLNNGSSVPQINNYNFEPLVVHFPESLPEQQRIVSILDEAFAAIAKAKENTEKTLQNAREVFDSYLQNVFANPGEGWVERVLGEITTKIGSGATPLGGEKSYKSQGISLIRSMNVHDMAFKIKDLAFIDDDQANALSNVVVGPGDVLLNITGASIGRCCLVPTNILPARVNQHVSIIRLVVEILVPELLHYALISKHYKDFLLQTGEKGGSTRQALTKAQIELLSIKFPPSIDEQHSIIAQLDTLSDETKKLQSIYQKKMVKFEELKKSVLQKALSGELT